MNIKRLKVLDATLQNRLQSIHAGAQSVCIFYRYLKKWYDVDGVEIASASIRSELDSARKSADGFVRPTGSRNVNFWIKEFEAVAIINFSSAIYVPAQRVAGQVLNRIVEDSINQYRASHDVHTGLKNRAYFDQSLISALGRVSEQFSSVTSLDDGASEATSESRPKSSVVLASLDIDHFKTINDRFGHGYGDLVLAALATRIENASIDISRKANSRYSIDVFRLGGEEFQILISGSVTEQEGVDVALKISASVRDELLPSKSEYQTLSKTEFADGTELPHDADRKVTVSIGVSALVALDDKVSVAAKRLKRQADLALNSAKISGRDRVRYFGEILERGGRVSSVDKVNGLISVDIGREIGVKRGQEFFLYPPMYDGVTDFYLGEGRSRKRVGNYPRFRAARISAFDVQNDVSFCRVLERESGVVEIMEGSTLEAIPLGSISHLVGGLDGGAKFSELGYFRAEVESMAKESETAVIAVSLRDIEEISEEKGVDKANECLGRVGRTFLSALKTGAKFSQVGLGGFVAVTKMPDVGVAGIAESLQSELKTQFDDVRVGVGWVCGSSKDISASIVNDMKGLVDAALLASVESVDSGKAENFSARLWSSALYRARDNGEYNRVIADYNLFAELGVSHYLADSQMAYTYFRGPHKNMDLAESFFRQAAAREGATPMIHANLGCFLMGRGQYAEGFALVRDIDKFPKNYWAARMYGALKVLSPEDFEGYAMDHRSEIVGPIDEFRVWISSDKLLELKDALNLLGIDLA